MARSWSVSPREIGAAARTELGLSRTRADDPNHQYTPYEIGLLAKVLGVELDEPEAPDQQDLDTGELEAEGPTRQFDRDIPSLSDFQPRDPRFPLYIHDDVLEGVGDRANLEKRLGVVLRHLVAHGGTTVVKGCADQQNKGWFRSPLGGSGGMQYYLWWAKQGTPQVEDLEVPKSSIMVRHVRHHDDHGPLRAGDMADYVELAPTKLDEDLGIPPWTEPQLQFVESEEPVRVVVGRPGAGKTTVLWKSIEARTAQRVLYLTWSRNLRRHAQEYLDTFASSDVDVTYRDFLTFVGEVRGRDVERLTLAESRARFVAATERLGDRLLGPWVGRLNALHGELRAHLFGAAVPGMHEVASDDGVLRLTDEEYLQRRGRSGGVGSAAARSAIDVVRSVEAAEGFTAIFPELQAAGEAIDALREVSVPQGYEDLDRIVVDEVQDLTLVEAAVVIEIVAELGSIREYAPFLLAAGDEGQTVRPTGFDWGQLKDLVGQRILPPVEFQLQENLRCPEQIAAVVQRASELYGGLDKDRRPGDQQRLSGNQSVGAHLIHAEATSSASAMDVLRELQDIDGLVILTPEDEPPLWIDDDDLGDVVMSPADAKGLEYQSVCVIDPGRLLETFARENDDRGEELEQQAHRTAIDQLRVALSRATETLAFLDVEASPEARQRSRELLGDPAFLDVDDLPGHISEGDDLTPEERVATRISDARALVDERPKRAWRRAHQAVRLLGRPDLPNGVADESLRHEAHETLVETAARLLVDGLPEGLARTEVIEAGSATWEGMSDASNASAFELLAVWSEAPEERGLELLLDLVELSEQPQWLSDVLAPRRQMLRQRIDRAVERVDDARRFSGDVETWLELVEYPGDRGAEAMRLRGQAVDTLLDGEDVSAAEAVLARIDPDDPARTGRVREAQGRWTEAATAYEEAAIVDDALRCWRTAGEWSRAHSLATGEEADDLAWLVNGEQWLAAMTNGRVERLTGEERRRMVALLRNTAEELKRA